MRPIHHCVGLSLLGFSRMGVDGADLGDVIKTVRMGIPILISRSGFTAWGVDLARYAGLTLIGRAKGKRFVALAGSEHSVFDSDIRTVEEEHPRFARKASLAEDAA